MAAQGHDGAPNDVSPAERVTTLLSCVAVDRRIGGVIFVDLEPGLLSHLGRWLCDAIEADPSVAVTLGSTESDDDLWWRPAARQDGESALASNPALAEGSAWLMSNAGLLADPPYGPPLALIPDLARASLAVTRAAVVLADTNAAVADRHGQHLSWEPRTRWLAACARADLARLSSHLLDRFPVRVDASGLTGSGWSLADFRAALGADDPPGASLLGLPPADASEVRAALRLTPRLGGDAADLVVRAVGTVEAPTRRDLALARIARALAALDASEEVRDGHVRRAAAVAGLTMPVESQPPEQPPVPQPDEDVIPDRDPGDALDNAPARDIADERRTAAEDLEPVAALHDVPMPEAVTGTSLYPEDAAGSIPEFASLSGPSQWRARRRAPGGLIIGAEPTRELADLSVLATVLEAAKFQQVRHAMSPEPQTGLVICGADLRRHRRQSGPDTTVALVLDHTCRPGWQWAGALAPYLRWAYTRRAAITMVEFGHRRDDGTGELRAELYRAKSVLDRRITESLSRLPGRASPLADGLDLVIQDLRRQLRYGMAATEEAWLVVVSDGRGNVPLEASLRGRVSTPVGNEGVQDALAVAAGARSLSRVRRVVIAPPGLTHYQGLPFDLADALGGIVAEILDGAPEGEL